MNFSSNSKKRIKETIKEDLEAENIEYIKDNFTRKDWKNLENKLNSRTYLKIIAVGYMILFISLFIGIFINEGFLIFLIPGLILAKLPLYIHFKKKKVKAFVKNIVEYELTTDKTVLPPWFKIKSHEEVPYRRKPDISEDKLRKIVNAEKWRRNGIVVSLILLIISEALIILFSGLLELSFLDTIILFFSPQIPFFAFFLILVVRTNELNAIQNYEEITGETIIPEEYKSELE